MREGILAADIVRCGSRSWTSPSTEEVLSAISYEVVTSDRDGLLRLSYTRSRTGEALEYFVRLQTTRPHLGGLRWWFTCPLASLSRACGRRCGKLYLCGSYFGCRVCHRLTYTSCRESHRWDGLWRQLGGSMGMEPRAVRRVMERGAREDRRIRERYGG